MISFSFIILLGIFQVRAFLPINTLKTCPNVSPQKGLRMDQITGSWRLAYMFIDDNEDLEEDTTCAIVEAMQINETNMELMLYVDGRSDEYTIDRYAQNFDVTILEPGEWLIHTPILHLEFVHVTVIGHFGDHLILTFCANPFSSESEESQASSHTEHRDEYDALNSLEMEALEEIFRAHSQGEAFKDLDDFNLKLDKQILARRPSRRLKRRIPKRFARSSEDNSREEGSYERMAKYLRQSSKEPKKHLWTVVLVKNNNVSALKYVENASLLMKYGFDIMEGQLISFGSCSNNKK